jgi:hypothetical protein
MRKAFGVAAIALIVAVVFGVNWYATRAGQDRGQAIIDAYADPAVSSAEKTEFHRALRRFLNEGGDDVGSVDISDLRAVYGMAWGKASVARSWNDPARYWRLWRMNFALGVVRYGLSSEQVDFLVAYSDALPSLSKDQIVEWDARAALLFDRSVGRGLFATIGLTGCAGSMASRDSTLAMLPTCVCTTNAGNWSCNDSCHGAGSCTVDPGNCGVFWLWDCNGMCDNSNEGN